MTFFTWKMFAVGMTAALWYFVVWFGDEAIGGLFVSLMLLATLGFGMVYAGTVRSEGVHFSDSYLSACAAFLFGGVSFGSLAHPVSQSWWSPWLLVLFTATIPLMIEICVLIEIVTEWGWLGKRRSQAPLPSPPTTTDDNVTVLRPPK